MTTWSPWRMQRAMWSFTLTPTSCKHARQNPVLSENQTTVNATQAYSYLREMDISKDSHRRRHRLTSCLPKHPNRKAHSGKYRTNVPKSLIIKQQHRTPPPVVPFKPHQQLQRPERPSGQSTRNRRPAPPPPQSLAYRPGKRSYRPKIRKRSLQFLPHHIPISCRCPACLSVNESRPAARRIRRIFIRRDIKNS